MANLSFHYLVSFAQRILVSHAVIKTHEVVKTQNTFHPIKVTHLKFQELIETQLDHHHDKCLIFVGRKITADFISSEFITRLVIYSLYFYSLSFLLQ